jgi:hypothetical protein
MAMPTGDERIDIVENIIDAAGYFLRDWVKRGVVDDEKHTYTLYIHDPEDGYETEGLKRSYRLTYNQIWTALGKIATGKYTDLRRDIKAACRETYFEGEESEMDAEVCSCVVQIAALGEVIFG